jgi:membrane protein
LRPQNGILPRLRSSARGLSSSARGLFERDRAEMKPLPRAAATSAQLVVSCFSKLQRDRASQMASALSYQTLFSLLPLLVLALIVLHSVAGLESAGTALRNMIVEFLVPESLVAPDADLTGPPDPRGPATVEEFNDARQVLRRRVDDVLEALAQVSFAGIGTAGFLLFLYGATALMRTVEGSFNLIYQADAPRPWSRIPLYFTLLTLGPVALVSAQVLQDRLLHNIGSWMGSWVTKPLGLVAPAVVTCLVLVVAFRTVPNAWVAWRAAAIGGVTSGIAWYGFQEIFGLYVNRASMTSLYGALALLPLFLLWVYWSWLIILFGLTLSFTVQYLSADDSWSRHPILPGDPLWVVPVMVRIAEAFDHGETLTLARLSRELHLPPRVLRPYLRLLERRKYVRRLRDGGGDHVLTLARPMSTIKVAELIQLAAPPRRFGRIEGELMAELRRCELETAGENTLDRLVRRSPPGTRRGSATEEELEEATAGEEPAPPDAEPPQPT